MRRPLASGGREQPLRLGLLRQARRSSSWILLGELVGGSVPSRSDDPLREERRELARSRRRRCAWKSASSRSIRSGCSPTRAERARRARPRARRSGPGSSPPTASRFSSSTSSSPSPRADPLVGDRAVDVAVEQHVGAARERRLDHLGRRAPRARRRRASASAHGVISRAVRGRARASARRARSPPGSRAVTTSRPSASSAGPQELDLGGLARSRRGPRRSRTSAA